MNFIRGLFLSILLFGCVVEDESAKANASSATAEATGSTFSAKNKIYIDLTNATVSDSESSGGTKITTSAADFFDETVKVKYTKNDSGESTGVIRVDAEDAEANLAIYLSGTLSSGGVKVQTNTDYEVGVYLENVSITSTNYPAIDITKGGSATVFLSGENTLKDGRKFGNGYGDSADSSQNPVSEGSDSKGTLYCKGGLAICGDGSLSVTQSYKNCIASKDGILKIENGTFSLTSNGKNGLFGGQAVIIEDGTISIETNGEISTSSATAVYRKANGIKTDDDDYSESYVEIKGGSVTVNATYGKAISAPIVRLSGGTNSFTSSGTAVGANKMLAPPAFFMDAPPPPDFEFGEFPPPPDFARAPGGIGGMSGGNSGGSSSSATYTYLDADGVSQSGTITFAPEGIEGASAVAISGGTHSVSGNDDGINVSNTGGTLSISGGTLFVKSSGDGLDSNGNITISGGTVVVSQTGGGNSPIDAGDNYNFTVSGEDATVFALGSSNMFSESIPSSSSIPHISSTSLSSGNSSLGVDGIFALKEPQSYDAAILISNSLTSGNSYDFIQGGAISGTEIFDGVYQNPTISGGNSTSATATTSKSSSGNGARPNRFFNRRGF